MLNLNIEALQRFQVHLVDHAVGWMTVEECFDEYFHELVKSIENSTWAPNPAVATSVFMRRYGLFIAALLYLKAHNKMWEGPLNKIYLIHSDQTISFQIEAKLIRDSHEEDAERIIKRYGHNVVEAFAKKARISKLVLWENIWGYVLWMYSQTDTEQAKIDLHTLLQDHVWQPELPTSMFRRFSSGLTFGEAANNYQRVTCCLYKELPNSAACPYCPINRKK
ncbi:hypothetical protein BTR23_09520 [Alkalihalophilus pseudofirmus]|nr:hypothetical protein BTR23_09520 [Alkalihalophilus pseudofirmus]